MDSQSLHEIFYNTTFEMSCFKDMLEVETKPLIGLDGLDVTDYTILIKSQNHNGAYDYYLVQKYPFLPHITYKTVLEFLEGALTDKTASDCLRDIVECPGRVNKNSLRVFELVWDTPV